MVSITSERTGNLIADIESSNNATLSNATLSNEDILFAQTYFVVLAVMGIVTLINLFINSSIVFYIPFIIGGGGSLLFYIIKNLTLNFSFIGNTISVSKENESFKKSCKIRTKIFCHTFCSAINIAGAFILLVFYSHSLFAIWTLHVWIIPILIIAAHSIKNNVLIFIFLLGVCTALFVLDGNSISARIMQAVAMGSFWGFSFYYLLAFLNDLLQMSIKESSSKTL